MLTAATVLLGEAAVPMLAEYGGRIADGSKRFAAVCARSLGYSLGVATDSHAVESAAAMLGFAEALRGAIFKARGAAQ